MAKEKKLIKGPWSWTKDDIRLLKKLYPHGNTRKIAERLNRPLTAVRQKAYDIGMKTNVYQYWSKGDMKLLEKLYPNAITQELAERLGRSAGSIKTKARQLGLRKTDSYLKTMRSRPRKRRKKKS
jgi:transcriptional regulator of aromatic amino acid metabolism